MVLDDRQRYSREVLALEMLRAGMVPFNVVWAA